MKKIWLAHAIKVAIMIVAFGLLISWVVMSLWNNLLPALFGWPAVTFTQALGLLILSRILFGGFRGHGGHRGGRWRRRQFERWQQMTPEEREKLREGLRHRCGPWGKRSQE